MHTLKTSRIVFHYSNGLKESYSLGMFHSCISLLLVQVEQLDILWEPITHICTNDPNTRITSPIKNIVRDKVVVYHSCWLIMKQVPLAGHNYTDHLQKSTLEYVEFVWTCS